MAGRPRRVFTDDDIAKMDDMASINCKDCTIAEVLCIPFNTFKRHFGKRMKEKRAEFKMNLRRYQSDLAKSNPAMAIFLGKNELNQTDRQDIVQSGQGLTINVSTKGFPRLHKAEGA